MHTQTELGRVRKELQQAKSVPSTTALLSSDDAAREELAARPMGTISGGTVNLLEAQILNAQMPKALEKTNYPNVHIWTWQDFANQSSSKQVAQPDTSQPEKGPARLNNEGKNVETRYLFHKDGSMVSGEDAQATRACIKRKMLDLETLGPIPPKFSLATSAQMAYLISAVGKEHPYILFSHGHWKAKKLISRVYSGIM